MPMKAECHHVPRVTKANDYRRFSRLRWPEDVEAARAARGLSEAGRLIDVAGYQM